jgi:ADP-dependent NAD(P)H-hydrate dehydratase
MTATAVTREFLRSRPLPQPSDDGDKDQRGRVLVVGGSLEVPGAALLAGIAALRAGAGKLQIATCRSVAPQLGVAVPEARVIGLDETLGGGISADEAERLAERAGRCDALLLGPGMVNGDGEVSLLTARLLERMERGPGIVIDAAALHNLHGCDAVLRRHAGRVVGAVVAMKGGCTFIVGPDGAAWRCDQGNVGLATSGSGDTLAGVVAGLLARGADPVGATLWGVYLHGEAGDRLARTRGPVGFLARELLAEIPSIMAGLDTAQAG